MGKIILTKENACKVETIRNIENPEWGSKRFTYNETPLSNGFAHGLGSGCNSKVLYEEEFKYWEVVSFKK